MANARLGWQNLVVLQAGQMDDFEWAMTHLVKRDMGMEWRCGGGEGEVGGERGVGVGRT